jgi:hypothetical protein
LKEGFMDVLFEIVAFIKSNPGESVLGGLLLISEGLASIKAIEANSIFQFVVNGLKRMKDL